MCSRTSVEENAVETLSRQAGFRTKDSFNDLVEPLGGFLSCGSSWLNSPHLNIARLFERCAK